MTQHTVGIPLVHELLREPAARGVDIAAVLRRAYISPALLESDQARVSRSQYAALMRTVKRVMRDEFWGWGGQPLPPGTFAVLCRRLVGLPDLGAALRDAVAFLRLFLRELQPRLVLRGDAAILLARRKGQPLHGAYDFGVATLMFECLQVAGWLVDRRLEPRCVTFRCRRPEHIRDSVRLLTPNLHFEQGENSIVLDAGLLQLPVVRDAQCLRRFLAAMPENLILPYRASSGAGAQVRHHLRQFPFDAQPSLEQCAASLGVAPQTLRRRLSDEGTGFRVIAAELRRDAAIGLLARRDLSLSQIAGMLGFSESSTFHRAFKKATGVAPGEYRRHHLTGAADASQA
ncbi:AraC family transcriptional regulator [Verticiella sediminum]|nr:AraC family transcriptional regulator [Verticiella sediminum]